MNPTFYNIYKRLPSLFQHVAVSIKGEIIQRRRFDGSFESVFRNATSRESLSKKSLRQFQSQRLAKFLRKASNSSFWQRQFTKFGVDPYDGEPFGELSKLSILSKATVKQRSDAISLAAELDERVNQCDTSGTTGSGLRFVETHSAEREQWAIWWRYRTWHGLTRSMWCGTFGGRRIVNTEDTSPPFWRFNLPGRQIRFSNYHLAPENADAYAKTIQRYGLRWLHGYPSALALLGQFVLEQDLGPFPDVGIVTTGAENLLASQRATIKEAFDCTVRQHYGLAEAVANISECEEGRLHVDEDFAGVEFIPVKNGVGYRIVGTNWSNPAFPLFRYNTGDIAELADDQSCPCGRLGRIVESINGRQEDYVILPNGARIGRLDHIFKNLVAVREAQIYQPDRDTVIFRVVTGADYDEGTEEELLREARSRLGSEIDLRVEYHDQIERTDAGKIRFVKSDIDSIKVGDDG